MSTATKTQSGPSPSAPRRPIDSRPSRWARAGTVAAAVAAALAGWLVADPLLGVELVAGIEGQQVQIGPGPVITVSLVASLAGWASLALLERATRRGARLWIGLAVVATVVSLVPVTSGATPAATVVLGLLHLVVAAVLVPGLARTSPQR